MGKESSYRGEETTHSEGTLSLYTKLQPQSGSRDSIDPGENGIPAIQCVELAASDAAPWRVWKKSQPKTRMIT
jgi:hypothetical protein